MSALTAALYGALVVYLGGWYIDLWHGNFALLLLCLTVVTFCFWVAERFRFLPEREAAARGRAVVEDAVADGEQQGQVGDLHIGELDLVHGASSRGDHEPVQGRVEGLVGGCGSCCSGRRKGSGAVRPA